MYFFQYFIVLIRVFDYPSTLCYSLLTPPQPLIAFNPATTTFHNQTLIDFEAANGKFTLVDHRKAYIKSGVFSSMGLTTDVMDVFVKV